jgi:hypothetical protein
MMIRIGHGTAPPVDETFVLAQALSIRSLVRRADKKLADLLGLDLE